jgi:hypothetical protein
MVFDSAMREESFRSTTPAYSFFATVANRVGLMTRETKGLWSEDQNLRDLFVFEIPYMC